MFCVFLKFSTRKDQAPRLMAEHKRWIDEGFEEGVFLMTGSLSGNQGGLVIAHGTTREVLEERVARDPFVKEDVVRVEIAEFAPNRADGRLQFLVDRA
ncbi:YciI family protein [Variovorax guangxiensis]|nr:YciI family protein [Variovorax guangxiensis]